MGAKEKRGVSEGEGESLAFSVNICVVESPNKKVLYSVGHQEVP